MLRDRGQLDAALRELSSAFRAARESGSRERLADVTATRGVALVLAGRSGNGLAELASALELASGATRARVLMRRAHVLGLLGLYRDALDDLRKATTFFRATNDVIWEARSLNNRCLVYLALGSLARAQRDALRAERLFEASGQQLEAVHTCQNQGLIAYHNGDLPEALALLEQAGRRYHDLGVPAPELAVDQSSALLAAGLASHALSRLREELTQDDLQPSQRAELLLAAANAALAAAEPDHGGEYARQAERMFRAQHRDWWLLRSQLIHLRCRFAVGRASRSTLTSAVEIAQSLREEGSDDAAMAFLLAGQIAARRGDASAPKLFRDAASARRRGSALNRSIGWLAQALAFDVEGQHGRVLSACRRGLDTLDEHRMTLGSSELRALATAHGRALSDLALRHAAAASARTLLEWSERTRATTLLTPSVHPPSDSALASQLAALRAVASRLDEARAGGMPTTWLQRERARHEAAIRARQHHARGAGPGSRALPSVGEIAEAVGDALLMELVDVDGTLYAITVRGGTVRRHEIGPVTTAARAIDYARFQLRRIGRGAKVDLDEVGERLEQAVLGEVLPALVDAPVVIVPPSRLHAGPWGLAPSLLHRPFTVAPSAAMWMRSRRRSRPAQERLVLVAGPGLGTEGAEVHAVAARRPDAELLDRDNALSERVLAAIDSASLVHIAAHGTLRLDNPMFSELRLCDGPLTVHDFERLHRAPYRLVLSACDSGMVAAVGTDELLGMATTLLGMGSAGVIASVTVVHDAATVAVMDSVHRALEGGADLADALLAGRQAADGNPLMLATAASFVGLGA